MITYLAKLLNTYEDCQIDETCANEVLEGLENMGMLPPERKLISQFIRKDQYNYEYTETYVNKTHTWEPEDE